MSWDLITSAGALFNRYLVDKQSSTVTGTQQNNETWNTATTNDPDKLQLMRFAYERAFGAIDPIHDGFLYAFLSHIPDGQQAKYAIHGIRGFPLNNNDKVYPGWFCTGTKHQVPKDACYVGHCGNTYAWVMPNQVSDLSNFTLAILDIATYQPPGRQTPAYSAGQSILAGPP